MTDYKLVPVEPTAEMLCKGMKAYCIEDCEVIAQGHVLGIYKAVLAAAPAVQGEPVAWTWISGGRHVTADKPYADLLKADGLDVRPLYTAPQPAPDVAGLVEALEEGLRAIGDHHAPDDCYATGPMTGDHFRDLVQCPACSFIAMCDDVLAAHRKGGQP